MNKEILSIIKNLEITMSGQPWFGRAVFDILGDVEESKVNIRPGGTGHSMIELLWHMNTWAEFTLSSLDGKSTDEMKSIEEKDWRTIDAVDHSWQAGLSELKSTHNKMAAMLAQKDDSFLNEIVPTRKFNFRFMLNGLIQHNIYHLGQIAYINKLLM